MPLSPVRRGGERADAFFSLVFAAVFALREKVDFQRMVMARKLAPKTDDKGS